MRSGELAIEDIAFILPNNGIISEQWLERQLAAAGILPRIPIRYVEFSDVIQTMIESGFGASILMAEQVDEAVRAKRLAVHRTRPAADEADHRARRRRRRAALKCSKRTSSAQCAPSQPEPSPA